MCNTPLKILNRSKVRLAGIDSKYIYVPCGNCPDCRKRKSNDVFVRSYFEYEYCRMLGGFAQMFTLTYNEENLPFCTSRHIPCFSREDITLFVKRLRQSLCRRYNLDKSLLRYNLVCEYGGLFQRPHYHVVFFVNSNIVSPFVFKRLVINAWHKGFVSTTSINDGIIINLTGLAYISKYVSKDTITSDFFKSQIDYLRRHAPHEIEELKKHMPFNRRSIYFGDFALDERCLYMIKDRDLRTRTISIPDYKLGMRKFSLPLHYVRKMLYNSYLQIFQDNQGKNVWRYTYFLNDLGKKLYKEKVSILRSNFEKELKCTLGLVDNMSVDFVNMHIEKNVKPFTLISLQKSLVYLSNNFSSEFVDFAFYYAPYIDIRHFDLQKTNSQFVSTSDFVSTYLSALDYKEKVFCENVMQVNVNRIEFLYDEYLNKLYSTISHIPNINDYVFCLYLIDVLFEYKEKFVCTRLLDFEKSALFRRYVYQIS